ncbi:aqualysin-1-like [Lytechinus variegatus]|uniref:aqualysin-1-like n=1 Tax=Lytechinus variegatus TaxID=7654 RepID=UPI001BB143CE|nr:aqualysin-1-like [Lytechinus variegatus]XP_041454074.1 aqualysin-1-like [Lytechinus variegatus]
MQLIFTVLSALVVATTAKNATFYKVEDAIKDHYIVVMEPGYEAEVITKLLMEDNTGTFSNVSIKHTYKTAIKGFSAKLTDKALQKLLAREEIKYISQDGMAHATAVASWGLDRIDQRELPLLGDYDVRGDGSGVNVYVIDTGIYPESLYFGGRATPVFDSIGDGRPFGVDCNGHGTHCAGTVGASMYGVAANVQLFGLRVLNCAGSGSWSGIISACDYVAQNGNRPALASMSLGGGASTAVDDAVRGMIASGVTAVVAAGNSADNACGYSPARVSEAITVGATDINDSEASFSNYGTCVDVYAPGVDIPSTWIGGTEETRTISGTSMATPHVTGAIALRLAKRPNLTPARIKKRVINKSTKNVITNIGPGSPNRLLYAP